MESTTVDSMCRCCAAEGLFKDIKTSYHWMGEEEVYGDMLRECFDVKLAMIEQGGICEVCITQLRNATNFKKQVQHTEKKFKRQLDSGRFKATEVKEEVSGEERAHSSDENDQDVDNDNVDDEDYMPDFEIPIKTESPEEKSRKRGAKASTSRAKRSRLADDADKNNRDATRSVKQSDRADSQELENLRHNICQILLRTNATPIRRHSDLGYACCFCIQHFILPADLKVHTLEHHDNKTKYTFMKTTSYAKFLVKLDVTDLQCNLCGESIPFAELAEHIQSHGTVMHSVKDYVLPFIFHPSHSILECAICAKQYSKFTSLQVHMYEHYRNFECSVCGAGFVNETMVVTHYNNTHKLGTFSCFHCEEVFDTLKQKNHHEHLTHSLLKYKCGYCGVKFHNYDLKRRHQIELHSIEFPLIKCSACDKSFSRPSLLTNHVKKYHLMEKRYYCSYCDMAYFYKYRLDEHLVSHERTKEFECKVCNKSFGRVKSLREHVKIHAGDRRFECKHCNMKFVQKITLKRHLEKKHDDVL